MVLGVTPVLRWQRDDRRGWYIEVGIGLQYLSDRYRANGRQLSTRWQFGDRLGIGYGFGGGWGLGLEGRHVSNGGLQEPNDGVNLLLARLSYRF